MEVMFENRYHVTDEMLSEYVKRVICKRTIWTSFLILLVASPMLALTLLWQDYVMSAVFFACIVIAVAELLAVPPLTVKQMKEYGERIHGGKECETIVRFGDKISLLEGDFSLSVEYSQIIKIHYLRHSSVLMFGKRNGIMLDPAAFTVGSFEEFQTFIKEKCP